MKPYMGLDSKGRMHVRLVLPLPPSDNKIYFNTPYGGRALTSTAEAYKKKVREAVGRLAMLSNADFLKDVPYTQILTIYFKSIRNKGAGKNQRVYKEVNKVRTRTDRFRRVPMYKKVDATNRVKLITDAVSESIGIDDSHILRAVTVKSEDADNPRVEIVWREQEPR